MNTMANVKVHLRTRRGNVNILTCPCNVDPITTYFYIVKLGFTGVYTIFFFLLL